MGIKNPVWLIDWLAEQRSWSKWADGVVLYYEAHGFITQKQYDTAILMYKHSYKPANSKGVRHQNHCLHDEPGVTTCTCDPIREDPIREH